MRIASNVTPPPAPAAVTLVSASGKRMHPRVDIPLSVEFERGGRREARDWSVAGFSLPGDGPRVKEGTIHPVRMIFGLADCDVAVDADAKVSWCAGGQARGFRFVGLSSDKSRILDHFIQSGLEGDSAIVGGLPVAHRAIEAVGRPGRARRFARSAMQAGKLAVVTGVVLGGSTLVLSRFLTVSTDYAAVSAELQQLHAPEAGFLRSDKLAVGTRLGKGETIGTMQPVATPQARLATETEIAALQATRAQQTAALDQARAGFATFLQTARTDLAEATAARAMLEQQVVAEDKVFGRVVAMQAKGIVADERVDQEQQVSLTLRRTLSTARDAEAAMRQKLVNAEAGRFTSDGRSTQKSPADLRDDVSATEASIQRLTTMLASLDAPLPILSPCDCTVTSLAATPGAYVAAGAHVADLAHDAGGGVSVDALVQNARLSLVREGQAVTVYLANRPDGLTGHVTGINFDPANTGRTGLPVSLRTLDDYGLMTVAVDAAGTKPPSGLPATVMAPVGWRALMGNTPVVAWVGGIVADAAGMVRATASAR